jgi:NitT/TauT family transport system substrate-binding protein
MTAVFWKQILYLTLILAGLLQVNPTLSREHVQEKPIKVKVVSSPYLSYAPFFIAQEERFFAEQGLQIEFIEMSDASVAIPSLIKGDLDVMADGIWPSQLNAIARGAGIKIVADKGYFLSGGCASTALMVRRTLVEERKIERLSQIKGRRLAMNQASSPMGYFMEKILGQAGLTLDDVEKFFIPHPAREEAFRKGIIDLTIVSEPWVTRMSQAGHAVVWIPLYQVVPDFQYALLMYGPTFLERNIDTGKRFMVAYLKAVRQYNLGKTERNLKLVSKYTGLDQELLKKACWQYLRSDGRINIESVLDFQSWAVKRGFLDREVPPNQFWDSRYIEYANKVLAESKK